MVRQAARIACFAAVFAGSLCSDATLAKAHDDGLLLIRCTGFQVPIIAFPGTEIVGQRTETDIFDIVLQPGRNLGWFRGALFYIGPEKPAALSVSADRYSLQIEHRLDRLTLMERLVLDRVDGSIFHSTQSRGAPVSVLKSGGTCRSVDRRF